MELRMIAKDGSLHWIRDEAIMVNDDNGQPLWSQGIIVDITERKLGEQQLHEAEERYRSLIETIPAATYIDTVEAVSQAVYMSPQVAGHLRLSRPKSGCGAPTSGNKAWSPRTCRRSPRRSSA